MSKAEEKARKDAEKQRETDILRLEKWGFTYEFPEPFLQGDMAKYQTRLKKLGAKGEVAVSVYRGLILRVASDLDWLSGIKDIDKLVPGQVVFISGIIFDDILMANEIPNE